VRNSLAFSNKKVIDKSTNATTIKKPAKIKSYINSESINTSNRMSNPPRERNSINESFERSEDPENQIAMFHSMGKEDNEFKLFQKTDCKAKTEIIVDLNNQMIKSNDKTLMREFLSEVMKISSDDENAPLQEGGLNNFFDQLESLDKEFAKPLDMKNDEDFDFNEYKNVDNCEQFEEDENDEMKDFSYQVKSFNTVLNKNDKKRKKGVSGEEDEDFAEGKEKKAKNGKAEYFKKRAIMNKINKNRKIFFY
jgi:hypothetical protein